jgi:serine/threonine protein kinase
VAWNLFKRNPQQIGPFDLLDKLGQGGLGSVYKCRNPITGDLVAVKVISPEMAEDPVVCQRVRQEFEATRGLDHPHIVRTLEFGQAGPSPYLVMEFVDGENLSERLSRQGRLSEKEGLGIAVQLAGALAQIHQRGLVHRDVKPGNILLTPDGRAKLTDFGVVKDFGGNLQLTPPAALLGTPNFMAPEQFEDARQVDARADVYGLAATLYMAVTGELPFRSKTWFGVLGLKIRNQLPAPRELVPALGVQTDWAIQRALSHQPNQRPASCSEFVKNLTGTDLEEHARRQAGPRVRIATSSGADRRGSARYACDLDTSCRPVCGEGWLGSAQDISQGGIALLTGRRIEPGTVLMVDLLRARQEVLTGLLARVVRVQSRPPASWVIGCKWHGEFSRDDLRALV